MANYKKFLVYTHPCLEREAKFICNHASISLGLSLEQATKFARTMGFSESCVPSAADTMMKLYGIFIEKDALLIEINPMAEDSLGRGTVRVDLGKETLALNYLSNTSTVVFLVVVSSSWNNIIWGLSK